MYHYITYPDFGSWAHMNNAFTTSRSVAIIRMKFGTHTFLKSEVVGIKR